MSARGHFVALGTALINGYLIKVFDTVTLDSNLTVFAPECG